jgi:hypothetical protein
MNVFAALSAISLSLVLACTSGHAVAQDGGKSKNGSAPLVQNSGPAFSSLLPEQASVLVPLQPFWDEMNEVRKRKWIEIANRFPTLSDDEKNRVTLRMQEWAALTPAQRKQVRDNFTGAQGLSASDRQAQWEEYQKLSPEARQALIERAQQELQQKRDAKAGPVGAAATTRPSQSNRAGSRAIPD